MEPIRISFGIGIALALFFPVWPLTFLAPPIVIALYKRPIQTTLWMAMGSGFLMDLLGGHHLSFSYTLATLILYTQKHHFFEDQKITLPAMTFFFATLVTLFELPLYAPPISFRWILTDLIFMPLFDALYAYTLFNYFVPKRKEREYFL